MIARAQQAENSGLSCHARGESQSIRSIFEGGDTFLQHTACRIVGA